MISVIISFYKALDNLELMLSALQQQSFQDFEVIIAEDDNAQQTIDFLQMEKTKFHFPILHISQEDKGFRKCKILNKAIEIASGDKIVFLDGDCLPHRHLLKHYNETINEGIYCIGRRVMLSQKLSKKLKETKNPVYTSFIACLMNGVENELKHALYLPWIKENKGNKRGILGCNMGGYKSDLLAVNGFDEDYQLPAVGEDSDLEWRLRSCRISIKSVFYKCITYHLHHRQSHDGNSMEQINNRDMMEIKRKAGYCFCSNGIKKNVSPKCKINGAGNA